MRDADGFDCHPEAFRPKDLKTSKDSSSLSLLRMTVLYKNAPNSINKKPLHFTKRFFQARYVWRRRRDSNSRDTFMSTRFPGVRLKPLGHLSVPQIYYQIQNYYPNKSRKRR